MEVSIAFAPSTLRSRITERVGQIPTASRPNCAVGGIVPKELETQPPHHLRQGRTLPTDLKAWLHAQPDQPSTIAELQTLFDRFVDIYNRQRPHRSLPARCTPAVAYTTRPKAGPGDRSDDTHYRVRHDRVATGGNVTLRLNGQLHHIAVGRAHTGTRIILLIADLDVRIIHAATGEILRHLTLDPTRRYHGTGRPRTPENHDDPNPDAGSGCPGCPETSHSAARRCLSS